MIKKDYYKKQICDECCEKNNTDSCDKNFEETYVRKEKLECLKCKNYKRINNDDIEKEL